MQATKTPVKRILTVKIQRMFDDSPDTSYLEQEDFEDRLRQFNDGLFQFIGIRAIAEVTTGSVIQTISSGGLWGIEDDSDESYLSSVAAEELSSLRDELSSFGFSKLAIASAMHELKGLV